MLYKAMETTGINQTSEAIYQVLNKVIQEIGPEKVCSVVTDNASNMQEVDRTRVSIYVC